MTSEEIKKRFQELQGLELGKGAPWEYSKRVARKALLQELVESGMKNQDAVFEIHKAEQEL